jgi:fatty-acyl-CoA synthase
MLGQMMQFPLLISALIRHADINHGGTEIVSRLSEGGVFRYTYRDAHRRSRQLARALLRANVLAGEPIGTLGWNTHRHFETYCLPTA